MRRSLVLALAVAAAGAAPPRPAHAADPAPSERAFVEWTADPAKAYAGETVTVTLRVGTDEDWFRDHAATLFARPVDLPVHVAIAPADSIEGARALAPTPGTVRLAVGDATVAASRAPDVDRGGRRFAVVALSRRFVVDRPGTTSFGAARLRFAYADRFEGDEVVGRVPVDPHDVAVESPPLSVEVLPLPTAGRPSDFGGAVGRFRLRAEADRREVEVGEVFRVTLRLDGTGDQASLPLPRLDEREGFHLYGVRDDRGSDPRVAVLDVAALSTDVREVPSLALPYFDPETASYAVARTEALPLAVRAKAGAPPSTATPRRGAFPPWWIVLGAAAAVVAAAWLAARRRRGSGDEPRAGRT